MSEDYKEAGVDTVLASRLPNILSSFALRSRRDWVEGSLGGFSSIIDLSKVSGNSLCGKIAMTCDGVGTKLLLVGCVDDYVLLGRDAVAMCINDLLTVFARPLALMDYVAMGRIDELVLSRLVEGISIACEDVGCSLVGGETAEMPGVYEGEKIDVACFAMGVVGEKTVVCEGMEDGDIVLGLPSSGLHSNGFSLVRKVLAGNDLDVQVPFESDKATLREVLIEPTRLYHREVFRILENNDRVDKVRGMAHITGGGLADNVERSLSNDMGCIIYRDSWEIPSVFSWLENDCGVSSEGMWDTFNMGIGYVIVVRGSDFISNEWQDFIKIGNIVSLDKTPDKNETRKRVRIL